MRERDGQIIKRFDRVTETETRIIVPVVHLNGDSRETLVNQRRTVVELLRQVQEAMSEMSPNGRNYYPIGMDFLKDAEDQHRRRQLAIREILEDVSYEEAAVLDDSFDGD